MLQRDRRFSVPVLAVLVVDDGVAVGEGATAGVFTGQAHRVAAGDERSKRHVLAHAPIDVDPAPAHGGAVGAQRFCTRLWAAKSLGSVVMRSARRFHSVIGMAVSQASVHFLPRKGDQSVANLP